MSDISQIDTEVGGLSGPKREHERVGFYGLVKVAVPTGKEMDVFSENVSLGGIFLRSNRPLPIGQKVTLDFETDKGRVRGQEGEVRWNHQFGMFETDGTPGMGVQFGKMDPESQKIIGAFVDEMKNTKGQTTSREKSPRQFLDYPTKIDTDFQPPPPTREFLPDTIIEPDHQIAERIAKAAATELKKQNPLLALRQRAKPAALGLLFSAVIMVILFNPFRKADEVVSSAGHPSPGLESQSIQPNPFVDKQNVPVTKSQPTPKAQTQRNDRTNKSLKPIRLARPVFRRSKAEWQMDLGIGQTTRIKHYTLTKPARLVVDFFQASWMRESRMRPKVPFIKKARFGNQPQKARLVLDFQGETVPRYTIYRQDNRFTIWFAKIITTQ